MTMIHRPALSVVIPTRNRRHILERTMRSMLAQREVEIQVIVVDEASADDTPEYLDGHPDRRVQWIRNDEPQGCGGARNTGMGIVKTPYVAFCDDDDLWAPDRARAMINAIRSTGRTAWSSTGEVKFHAETYAICGLRSPPPDGDLLPALLTGNCIAGGGSAVLASTALMHEVGGFRDDLEASEDWECWIRLAQAGPHAGVDRPLLAYAINPGSHSHQLDRLLTGLSQVRELHADLASELGINPNHAADLAHVALQAARMGDRKLAAQLHARLALEHGKLQHLAYGVMSVFAPAQVARIRDWRSVGHAEPGQIRTVERWLRPLLAVRPDQTRAPVSRHEAGSALRTAGSALRNIVTVATSAPLLDHAASVSYMAETMLAVL